MRYIIETHMHTSETSRCGRSTAADMVAAYREAGYSTLVITDHFFNGNCGVEPTLDWQSKITAFTLGYRNALAAGRKFGINVLLGWEFGVNHEDYLTFGVGEDFLRAYPNIDRMPLESYAVLVNRCGGMIVQAHPYREASYITHKTRQRADIVNAIEVYNGSRFQSEFNAKALRLAELHNLPQTAGSDAHHVSEAAMAGMAFDYPITNNQELVDALRSNEGEILRRRTTEM